ncbi:hypothetical protein F511_20779 [Dorcoceras hygrometricum]|uniref:Uncharacterized protein n=1 Tax=Dorcoceras hygrometricum TaxID=472368 RepID=A0A2Z7C4I2_9LAMI|nr:hypothetical protein F511_20779 [Dorcoceras hygrometricum]
MSEKFYSAPELVKEDLQCHFGFSKKWVRLVGDLSERMDKAALLRALHERPERLLGAAEAIKVVKKRKAPSSAEKEARRQNKTSEAKTTPSTEIIRAPTPPAPTREEHPASMPPPVHTRAIPELSKKMMNSRRICPADGSQYKDSAVGLVFMESAAGLAMKTSKVESTVRNQAEAKLNTKPTADFPVQARRRKTHVYVFSHTVEAVVHLWSLGVLTAAGCGIGSVHEVVRSNLLVVEPSEVEEGEM